MPSASASLKLSSSVSRTSSLFMSRSARAGVEPDLADHRERARLVDLAAAGEQLLVELEILLAAGLVLHAHRDRDLRRLRRAFAEHREFLEHELSFGSVFISSILSASALRQKPQL